MAQLIFLTNRSRIWSATFSPFMSLYFVSGKIGAGKSYRGMVNIRDEILHGHRLIVTNLPLKLPEFSDYLAEHYPSHDVCLYDHWRPATDFECPAGAGVFAPGLVGKVVDGVALVFVPSRIRILGDDELKEFYRYRQTGTELVAKINQRAAGDKGPSHPVCLDFSPWGAKGRFAGQGVVYHLDECQLFYNVRKYAEAPEEMPFYLSQHRKLGDDIYVYTQKPENVDKMLRSFTQEFIYVTNVGKKKIGIFQPPKFFRMAAYPDVFTGAPGQASEWSRSFRMDLRLADCYETAKGIGIEAMKADKEAVARGISWRWALLLPILLAALFPAYGMISKHAVHKFFGQSVDALAAVQHQTNRTDGGTVARVVPGAVNDPSSTGAVAALPAGQLGAVAPPEKPNLIGRPLPAAPRLDARTVAQAVFEASESVPTVSHDVFFVGVWTTKDPNGRLVTTVALSDKTIYVLGVDKELTSVTAKYCIVGGVMYAWRSYTDMAREASTAPYPAYTKPASMATPPSVPRAGGIIVGGATRQY